MPAAGRHHKIAAFIAISTVLAHGLLPVRAGEITAGDARAIERIISLGGDVTEILYALGAADRIVAVDTTSKFPEDALKTKPNVGYLRALATEGVLSVNPSLIIASDKAGPPEVVKALKAANVQYLEVPDSQRAEGIVKKIRLIGTALRAQDAAETLAAQVEADFKALEENRLQLKQHKRALVILAVQNGRATVGGQDSSADAILTLAGLDNAAKGVQGFKPVSDEQLTEFGPDVVIVMRRVGEGSAQPSSAALALPGLKATPAGQSQKVIEMDGLYLLGFGPRAPQAARDLMKAAYDEGTASSSGAHP